MDPSATFPVLIVVVRAYSSWGTFIEVDKEYVLTGISTAVTVTDSENPCSSV